MDKKKLDYVKTIAYTFFILIFVSLIILTNDAHYVLYSFIPFLLLAVFVLYKKEDSLNVLKASLIMLMSTLSLYFLYMYNIGFALVVSSAFFIIIPVALFLIFHTSRKIFLYAMALLVPMFVFAPLSQYYISNSLIISFFLMLASTLALFIDVYFSKSKFVKLSAEFREEISRYGPSIAMNMLLVLLLIAILPLWPIHQQIATPVFLPSYAAVSYSQESSFLAYPYFFTEYCPFGRNSTLALNITANNNFDAFLVNLTNKTNPTPIYDLLLQSNVKALSSMSSYYKINTKTFDFNSSIGNCMLLLTTNNTYTNATARAMAHIDYYRIVGFHADSFTLSNGSEVEYVSMYGPTVYVVNEYLAAINYSITSYVNATRTNSSISYSG